MFLGVPFIHHFNCSLITYLFKLRSKVCSSWLVIVFSFICSTSICLIVVELDFYHLFRFEICLATIAALRFNISDLLFKLVSFLYAFMILVGDGSDVLLV